MREGQDTRKAKEDVAMLLKERKAIMKYLEESKEDYNSLEAMEAEKKDLAYRIGEMAREAKQLVEEAERSEQRLPRLDAVRRNLLGRNKQVAHRRF